MSKQEVADYKTLERFVWFAFPRPDISAYRADLQFFHVGDKMIVRYDFMDWDEMGNPVWTAQAGEYVLSYESFEAELQSLLNQFFTDMDKRIEDVLVEMSDEAFNEAYELDYKTPVAWDGKARLREEHEERKAYYMDCMKKESDMDWEEVRQAIGRVKPALKPAFDYQVRDLKENEIHLLEDFLYEAIFQREGSAPLPRSVIKEPELSIYIDDFGKQDDHCLVAEVDGKVVGAVWTRIIDGFGSYDKHTPELAIGIHPEFRNKGIGTVLTANMVELLKRRKYWKVSLAVQKDNYAVKMYEKIGFTKIRELKEEYLMIFELRPTRIL